MGATWDCNQNGMATIQERALVNICSMQNWFFYNTNPRNPEWIGYNFGFLKVHWSFFKDVQFFSSLSHVHAMHYNSRVLKNQNCLVLGNIERPRREYFWKLSVFLPHDCGVAGFIENESPGLSMGCGFLTGARTYVPHGYLRFSKSDTITYYVVLVHSTYTMHMPLHSSYLGIC